MKELSNRMVIYPKDVMHLTGKGARTSRYIIASIKKKKGSALVSVEAFCEYTGLRGKAVLDYLAKN